MARQIKRDAEASLLIWRFTSYAGFEAALRKRSGGAFLAVTEGFCKARMNKSARIALQNPRRIPHGAPEKSVRKDGFFNEVAPPSGT
ncbi:MAG: hypothetical protein J5585_03495, partial [Clostridia bacterium]|nr:hypothetical protein [Clostridia bacterium]